MACQRLYGTCVPGSPPPGGHTGQTTILSPYLAAYCLHKTARGLSPNTTHPAQPKGPTHCTPDKLHPHSAVLKTPRAPPGPATLQLFPFTALLCQPHRNVILCLQAPFLWPSTSPSSSSPDPCHHHHYCLSVSFRALPIGPFPRSPLTYTHGPGGPTHSSSALSSCVLLWPLTGWSPLASWRWGHIYHPLVHARA